MTNVLNVHIRIYLWSINWPFIALCFYIIFLFSPMRTACRSNLLLVKLRKSHYSVTIIKSVSVSKLKHLYADLFQSKIMTNMCWGDCLSAVCYRTTTVKYTRGGHYITNTCTSNVMMRLSYATCSCHVGRMLETGYLTSWECIITALAGLELNTLHWQ